MGKSQTSKSSAVHTDWNKVTTDKFDELQHEIPSIMRGTTPINLGSFGLVVDHGDGTITKVLLRSPDPDQQAHNESVYEAERAALQALNGTCFAGAQVPKMLKEEVFDKSPNVFAAFRMTKVPGHACDWNTLDKKKAGKAYRAHFQHAGALLAELHQSPELARIAKPKSQPFGTKVPAEIPVLDEKTNKALVFCHAYVKAHQQPGLVHGDFHSGNFLVGPDHKISGLFDFSFAGMAENRLVDFVMMPKAGREIAISEYERHSGAPVDRTLVTMTAINLHAPALAWHLSPQGNPEYARLIQKELHEDLASLGDVPGLEWDKL